MDSSLTAGVWRITCQFPNGIHLINPNDELPYSIYTDASKLAISAVLKQTDEKGEIYIISTASRVLTATEQKYSTWAFSYCLCT